MLTAIANKLKEAKEIAIFSHLNPDGDAIGSSFAMKYVLEHLGKKVTVYFERELHKKFSYLGEDYVIGDETVITTADTALVLDCGNFDRMGALAAVCEKVSVILCVDHHYSGEPFGTICYKEPDCAATAQIVYRLACLLTEDIPLLACEAMYTGISTDTGHFKFSNATADTFQTAAALIAHGVEHRKITQAIYDTVKYEKLIFLGKAAEKIQFFANGKAAMLKVPESFLAEYGLTYEDVEELPNLALSIEGVLVSVLVKDHIENKKRVSLRGKDVLDLSQAAETFGGGGHKNAAAFVAWGDTDKMLENLQQIITRNLGEANV